MVEDWEAEIMGVNNLTPQHERWETIEKIEAEAEVVKITITITIDGV